MIAIKKSNTTAFLTEAGDGKTITWHHEGGVIIKQGAPANAVFYLQDGTAKSTVASDQGKEAVFDVLEPGVLFGLRSLLGRSMLAPSTVTALTLCKVTTITADTMRQALSRPDFSAWFNEYLLRNNAKNEDGKIDFLLLGSQQRLAKLMLRLAHIKEGDTKPQTIGPELTQEMFSEMVPTTRPRVNLFLNRFRNMGYIKYNAYKKNEGPITVFPTLAEAMHMPEKKKKKND